MFPYNLCSLFHAIRTWKGGENKHTAKLASKTNTVTFANRNEAKWLDVRWNNSIDLRVVVVVFQREQCVSDWSIDAAPTLLVSHAADYNNFLLCINNNYRRKQWCYNSNTWCHAQHVTECRVLQSLVYLAAAAPKIYNIVFRLSIISYSVSLRGNCFVEFQRMMLRNLRAIG